MDVFYSYLKEIRYINRYIRSSEDIRSDNKRIAMNPRLNRIQFKSGLRQMLDGRRNRIYK